MMKANQLGALARTRMALVSIGLIVAGLFTASQKLLGQDEQTIAQQGLNAAKAGDFDTAIADFTKAIQLDPKFATWYGARGDAYLAKGDYDKAIADFGQVLQFDPKDKIAYRERGNAYARKGNFDSAIADFDQAIQIDPQDAATYCLRAGNAYLPKGDYDKAIADSNQAIQLDPKNSNAYLVRGRAYSSKGDNDTAIADLNQAIQLDSKNSIARADLGIVYAKLAHDCAEAGDFDNAVKWESKYLETPNLSPSEDAEGKKQLALYRASKPHPAASDAKPVVNPPTPAPAANASQVAIKPWAAPDVMPAKSNWTWTTSDGKTYQNVVITKMEANNVTIMHSLGVAHIPVNLLPPDVKKQLNYP